MNWIKENKIRIIIIAVAVVLLAGIGTVIALNTKQTKIDPADSNQSDVVINESSKEDVTTKKDDVIKESENTTEADKEEETTSKDDKNVEEETTPAAAEPTTPYVAPTTKPQAKPTTPYVAPTTKPQAKPTTPYVAPTTKPQTKPTTPYVAPTTKPQTKPTTPQPTRPTEPATTAPVIHGRDGVILDTLYMCNVDGKIKLPESKAEMAERFGGNTEAGYGILYSSKRSEKDFFGIGLILNQSTIDDVKAYFGQPSCEKDTEYGMVIKYNYKNTDIYIAFNFFKNTGKIRAVCIDGDKGLDAY